MVVHDEGGFFDGRVVLDGDDVLLHDVADAHLRQERGDFVARERRCGRRRDAHDVAVAQEADELAVVIDDGQAAEAVLLHQILRGRDLRVRRDGEGVLCHAVCNKHCQHPFSGKHGSGQVCVISRPNRLFAHPRLRRDLLPRLGA